MFLRDHSTAKHLRLVLAILVGLVSFAPSLEHFLIFGTASSYAFAVLSGLLFYIICFDLKEPTYSLSMLSCLIVGLSSLFVKSALLANALIIMSFFAGVFVLYCNVNPFKQLGHLILGKTNHHHHQHQLFSQPSTRQIVVLFALLNWTLSLGHILLPNINIFSFALNDALLALGVFSFTSHNTEHTKDHKKTCKCCHSAKIQKNTQLNQFLSVFLTLIFLISFAQGVYAQSIVLGVHQFCLNLMAICPCGILSAIAIIERKVSTARQSTGLNLNNKILPNFIINCSNITKVNDVASKRFINFKTDDSTKNADLKDLVETLQRYGTQTQPRFFLSRCYYRFFSWLFPKTIGIIYPSSKKDILSTLNQFKSVVKINIKTNSRRATQFKQPKKPNIINIKPEQINSLVTWCHNHSKKVSFEHHAFMLSGLYNSVLLGLINGGGIWLLSTSFPAALVCLCSEALCLTLSIWAASVSFPKIHDAKFSLTKSTQLKSVANHIDQDPNVGDRNFSFLCCSL